MEAFGVSAETAVRLPGGQGTVWRAGDLILKPVTDPVVETWIADVVDRLQPHGYRVPRPVRAVDGAWLKDGWCAWTVVEGEHGSSGRAREILDVARRLHADLAHLGNPRFDHRDDVWSVGDRVAWGTETYQAIHSEIGGLVARLEPLRRSEGLPDQVVHADVFGNVLFADGLSPAVIDLSPYWRPAPWALAVAMVDAMAWYQEERIVLEVPHEQSLLARAAIFRLVTSDQATQDVAEIVNDWTRVVDVICSE